MQTVLYHNCVFNEIKQEVNVLHIFVAVAIADGENTYF